MSTTGQVIHGAIVYTPKPTGGGGGGGSVNSVSGASPIESSGGTDPIISIAKADAVTNGYLSSTDWSTFNNKQAAGSYALQATAINTSGPLTGGGNLSTTRTIAITLADTTHDGYLSSTDWNTFNGKQAAGSYITALTGDVVAAGPGSASATIQAGAVTDTKVAAANKDGLVGVASMRTLGTGAQQATAGNDSRLSDARTPTAHAASHASGGGDPVTIAESQVTGLTSDLSAKALKTTTISAGNGLSGGGDLSANRTLTVAAADATITVGAGGIAVGTIAESQVTGLTTDLGNRALTSTTISAGTGLSGGGDLSTNRTLSIANTAVTAASYGSASSVATFTVNAQGQLTAAASVSIAITESQVTSLVSDLAARALTSTTASAGTGLSGGGTLASNFSFAIANTAVTAASYGSASQVPTYTVNAQGQLTAAANVSIAITESQVTSLVSDLAARALTTTSISAGTGLSGGGDLSTSRTLSIANTAVTAASYGSASAVATFTVNAQGQLTAAATTTIALAGSQITSGTVADARIAAALTGKSYNGLVLSSLAVGFSLAGGTTSKTLTVPLDAIVSGTNTGDQDLSDYALKNLQINYQGGDYTLVLTDKNGKYIRIDDASPSNLTVPTNASVALPLGVQILIRQVGAGQVTIVPAGGVTIHTALTMKLRTQGSTASLIKVDIDEWDLTGDLEVP